MQRWIALFRGINVGGKHVLPMKELAGHLEALKLKNVRTYIQSGNVVFDTEEKNTRLLARKITERIEQQHGFGPHVLLIRQGDFNKAIQANPFPDAVSDSKSLHFFFLDQPAEKPNLQAMEQVKAPTETFMLTDGVFYLHAPEGIGRSKLAAKVEKLLGVTVTARNHRTVEKLAALAGQS